MTKPITLAPKVTLDLQLTGLFDSSDPEKSSADALPLCLASQGVQGALNLKYDDSALPVQPLDVVKISLHGTSRVRVPCKGPGVRDTVQRYSQSQFPFLDLVDVSHVGTASASANETAVGFSFVLPKVVYFLTDSPEGQGIFSGKNASLWSSLPSSLSAESIITIDMNGGTQRVHAKIIYNLRAQVFRRSKSIGYATRILRIYDDVDIQPPICISDFPSDYHCQQQRPLKRHFRKTGACISAAATEPASFVLYSTEDSASTILPVRFTFHLPADKPPDNGLEPSPETIEATFTWRLKSLTFLSIQPLTSVPTILQSWRKSSGGMITVVGQQHLLKWKLSSWSDTSSPTKESSVRTWMETVRLPLFLTKPVLPTPPFFTPFISRRYNLTVQVRLEGRSSGQTTMRLEVPVQVVYRQERSVPSKPGLPPPYDARDESVLEGDDPEMEVPIYSP